MMRTGYMITVQGMRKVGGERTTRLFIPPTGRRESGDVLNLSTLHAVCEA